MAKRSRPDSSFIIHPSSLLFEDDDILVVSKPPGLLTSTVPRERRPTLAAALHDYLQKTNPRARLGIIHRLDRDASGLLVFSKNHAAFRSLKNQFFHHTVLREYHAIVHGSPNPPAGRIESHLVERADGTVHPTRQHGKGELAITHYQTVRTEKKISLLRIRLETGRKHQIRVHLRSRNHPILGDRLYNPDEKTARLMLCATRLTLTHPRTHASMTFKIPLPNEFVLKERD
jgi:RluA family pseudouridine synthase